MTNNYKVEHDRDTCIGCSACASVCPKYWSMNSDGKADLIGATEDVLDNLSEDFEDNIDAAECCPVNCIHVYKDDKKLI